MAVLALIGAGVGGFALWRISEDPDVKKLYGGAKDLIEIFGDATYAKARDEVAALGCVEPLLFDVKKLMDFTEKHDDDFEHPKIDIGRLVVCNTKSAALTCQTVAEGYVAAASPLKPFAVMVSHSGDTSG